STFGLLSGCSRVKKLLALLLALWVCEFVTPYPNRVWNWRRRSESNGISENHYSRTTPRHQRRAASELSNANRIRGFHNAVKHSVKLRKNDRRIRKYRSTTCSLALSLALFEAQSREAIQHR